MKQEINFSKPTQQRMLRVLYWKININVNVPATTAVCTLPYETDSSKCTGNQFNGYITA